MTGNVVLLGFGFAGAADLPIVAPLVSLGSFLVGAAIAGRMVHALGDREPALYRAAIGGEVFLVACAAIVTAVATVEPESGGGYAVIALLAGAMGLRTAVVRSLGIPDLRTTVLTLTLTGLAAESRVGGGTGERTRVRLGAAAALFGGALIGALLEKAGARAAARLHRRLRRADAGALRAAARADEQLGELDGVERRALAEVVADDPQVEAAVVRRVAADAADEDVVVAGGVDRERVDARRPGRRGPRRRARRRAARGTPRATAARGSGR